MLWNRQAEAIRALKQRGITVKINTIIIPGVNDEHVPEVARRVAELGADIANCVPLYPVAGTALGRVEPPRPERVAAIRAEVARHLPIMEHCTRCRADAVGLLGEPMPPRVELALLQAAAQPMNPGEDRPYVAVATLEGVLVNQHLGEAERLAIYGREADGFRLIETRAHAAARRRPQPLAGPGRRRSTTAGPCWWPAPAKRRGPCWPSRGSRCIFMEGLDRGGARRRIPRRRNPLPDAESNIAAAAAAREMAKAACNARYAATVTTQGDGRVESSHGV